MGTSARCPTIRMIHAGGDSMPCQETQTLFGTTYRRARILTSILLASLLVGISAMGASGRFDQPEDAIRHFLACATAEEYECALRACAVDEIAERFDYEAMIAWLRAIVPSTQYLPSEYTLFAARNRHAVEYFILQQLSWMALSVVLPPKYNGFLTMHILTDSTVDLDDVVTDMNPTRFRTLEIVDIRSSHLLNSEGNMQNLVRQAGIYGADSSTSRSVLYKVDSEYFVGGFQLMQYDGGWLITSLSDPLIEQSAYGILIQVSSPEEFEEMLRP